MFRMVKYAKKMKKGINKVKVNVMTLDPNPTKVKFKILKKRILLCEILA